MVVSIHTSSYCNEIGRRENNEDAIYPRPGLAVGDTRLFLVCDGMGGHEKGEVASAITSEAIAHYWMINEEQDDTTRKLMAAIEVAVGKMGALDVDADEGNGMGTTLTLLSLGKDAAFVAHVGDSRIYQFRPGVGIVYRSKDHSLVQRWVDAGILTEQEARKHPKKNIITQVILSVPSDKIKPEAAILTDLRSGDYFLLCTDGVIEGWTDDELVDLFNTGGDAEDKMSQIVAVCRERSRDNFSAYLIQIQVEGANDTCRLEEQQGKEFLSDEDWRDIHQARVMREVEEALGNPHREEEDNLGQPEKISYLKGLLDKCLHAINLLLKKKES